MVATGAPGAAQVTYDLLRSTRPDDFLTNPVCVASDTLQTSAEDASVPGILFSYLVRVRNACGVSVGSGGEGNRAPAAACP